MAGLKSTLKMGVALPPLVSLGYRAPSQGGGGSPPIPQDILMLVDGDSLSAIRFYDPDTTTQPTLGTFRNASTGSFHNWAISRNTQPWEYVVPGTFAHSGETVQTILTHMTAPLAAATTAAATGKRLYASCLGGTNDIPNRSIDPVATIAADIQNWAGQYQAAGARPIIFKLPGSELWNATNVQRLIDLNTAMLTWVNDHAADAMKPLWCDLASIMWDSPPSAAQTDNSVAASQTPSSGVALTLASSSISGGRKLLFTHSEGTTRTLAIVGSRNGTPINETVSLTSGTALKASVNIYDTITSITPSASFTNPLKVGACGINQKVGYPYDSLHPTALGAFYGSQAIYDCVAADATPKPLARRGSNALLNPAFSTLTGGLVSGSNMTVNGVAASAANVPASWRAVSSNATQLPAADFDFTGNKAKVVITSDGTANLASISLRQDPSAALFTGGDHWEIWSKVSILAGSTALAAVSVSLSINYTAVTRTPTSASWSGGVVTMQFSAAHGLAIGSDVPITVTGMTPAGYNISGGKATITGTDTLTYLLASNPGTATVFGSAAINGVKLHYADRNSASTGGLVPATADQVLTYRFADVVIDSNPISSINFIVHAYMNGAGTATVTFEDMHMAKQP